MSKGTPVYRVRLPADLVELAEQTITLRNHNTRDEPWSFSEFVRRALVEKILKMNRSRGRRIDDGLEATDQVGARRPLDRCALPVPATALANEDSKEPSLFDVPLANDGALE